MQEQILNLISSLRDIKTNINMLLIETKFEDEALVKLSQNISAALEIYEREVMSERDGQAYDERHNWNEWFKMLDVLGRKMDTLLQAIKPAEATIIIDPVPYGENISKAILDAIAESLNRR